MSNIKNLIVATLLSGVAALSFAQAPAATPAAAPAATSAAAPADTSVKPIKKGKHSKKVAKKAAKKAEAAKAN